MKLLFAIKRLDSAAGGAERVFCSVCSALAQKGHDITIITFDRPDALPFYKLDERVKIIELNIGDSAEAANIRHSLSRIILLRRVITKVNPDVAVGFMHSMFIFLALSLMFTRIPVVASEHIVYEHYVNKPFQYFLFLVATPFISAITVLSDAIKSRYSSVISRKMVVIDNPLNEYVQKDRTIEKKIILNVGRLSMQKDQRTLIDAFSKVSPLLDGWELHIYGDGDLKAELESHVETKKLEGRVKFMGVSTDIGWVYSNADIFVISSRYEALGLATAEAMQYGLPVVGFLDCPGTNELIEDGVSGILVDPKNDRVNSLAEVMKNLMLNEHLRREIGINSRRLIRKRFCNEMVYSEWESLLQKVAR